LHLGGPESQVVSDELHNGGGVLVLVFLDVLDVGDGVVEGLLGQVAGLGGVVEALVVEHGEVEGESESDGVGGLQLVVGNLGGLGVGFEGTLGDLLVEVGGGVFGDVSEIVTLHLKVEDLGLGGGGLLDEVVVEQVQNVLTVLGELVLELLLVVLDEGEVSGVLALLLLLDGGDGSPGGTSGPDGVLVGDGEEVSLFDGQLVVEVEDDLLDVVEHVLESFGLFADLGHIDEFVSRKRHFYFLLLKG